MNFSSEQEQRCIFVQDIAALKNTRLNNKKYHEVYLASYLFIYKLEKMLLPDN